ncbi:MAG: carboxypeptidase-like regulatory domain-containing protein, partial [Oscillospiraceae bacterium]|nr:carboxypeptidase-like regulatory domain-containing protein [Oscillospiraceae bacterium]
FSFSGLTKGTAYTLKIPAGASWEAYTHPAVTLSASQAVNITLVSAVPSYAVSGVVTSGGAAVANVTVRAYAKTGGTVAAAQTVSAATNAQGQYTLNLIDGTYVLKVLATTDYKEYVSGDITVSGAALPNQNIALTLKPYIEGVVTLGDSARSGVYVYLYKSNSYVKSATTGADGKFAFKSLEESTAYTLRVGANSGYTAADIDVTTEASGVKTQNIALIPLVTVSGKVALSSAAVAGVYVYLYTNDGSYVASARAGADGGYTIAGARGDGTTSYKLKVSATADYAAYESDVFALSANETKDIALAAVTKYAATFTVNTIADGASFALYVYGGLVGRTEVALSEGVRSIQLPAGTYSYYYYYEGLYGSGSFTVENTGATVTITLPALYTISGTVIDGEGNAVSGASVNISVDSVICVSAVTDKDGKYSFTTKQTSGKTLAISARHGTAGVGSVSVTLSDNKDVTADISLAVKTVTVTVQGSDNQSIAGAYVSINSYSYGYTSSGGTLTLRNVGAGTFNCYAYKYGYKSTSVSQAISAESDTSFTITLQEDPDLVYTFSLGASGGEISTGGFVDLRPELKYTGAATPVSDGKITLTLPTGMSVVSVSGTGNPYSGDGYNVTFAEDKTVKLPSVRVTVDGTVGNLANLGVQALFTATDVTKSAYGTLTVVNATINAPGVVKAGEAFTVYGTAPTGSVVAIKAGTAVLKTAAVQNRYYKVSVSVASAGEYELQAVAASGGQTSYSPPAALTVTADAAPAISNAAITRGYLSTPVSSSQYGGIITFSTWVNTRDPYTGYYDIEGSFKVSNLGSYAVKSVSFAGAVTGTNTDTLTESGGAYTFKFPKNAAWRGTGVKPIIVTLTKDGASYDFTIALVTIMLDPSGYVYDAVTNERVAGATVTLEIKPEGGGWTTWIDPDGLQANPQTTDENGQYGWMVPEGEYRALVSKTGYADAVANKFDSSTKIADGGYDDTNPDGGFPVPPAQMEVNIPLKYTGKPIVSASWDKTNRKLTLVFTRPMPAAETKAELSVTDGSGAAVEGTWAVSADGRTFTFTPTTAPAVGSVLKAAIAPAALSLDGVAIGDASIPDVTVTEEQGGGGNTGGSTGG